MSLNESTMGLDTVASAAAFSIEDAATLQLERPEQDLGRGPAVWPWRLGLAATMVAALNFPPSFSLPYLTEEPYVDNAAVSLQEIHELQPVDDLSDDVILGSLPQPVEMSIRGAVSITGRPLPKIPAEYLFLDDKE
jgi:hypothetical protein